MTGSSDSENSADIFNSSVPASRSQSAESGQVSVSVLLTAVAVIGIALAFTVFAEAADVRSSTQKGADSAATAAAEKARAPWIEAWLRAQKATPRGETGIKPDEADKLPKDGKDKKPKDELPFDFTYMPPEPYWAAAASASLPAANAYAQMNDGGNLTYYVPEGGNRISVDVFRAKDSKSPQGKKYAPVVGGKSSATAQVLTPPGLTCAPLPNGTIESWTLECISAKGTATAQYAEGVLVAWDRRAFEKMYTIRLDR